MNEELKIADLKADKKRIEDEINEFVTNKLRDFMDKYEIDVNIDIELSKVKTCRGELFSMQTHTKLLIEL